MRQAMTCLQAVFQESTGQKQPETGCKLSTSEHFLWVQFNRAYVHARSVQWAH